MLGLCYKCWIVAAVVLCLGCAREEKNTDIGNETALQQDATLHVENADKRTNIHTPKDQITTEANASKILAIQSSFTHGAILSIQGAKWRLENNGLPKNTRQVAEGYWLGGEPSRDHVDELFAHNIRLILTASTLQKTKKSDLSNHITALGMEHLHIPFGGKFPRPDRFMNTVQKYSPEQIYIHCEHGGDRSGALLAYLLVTQHQWSVPQAMLAVAFPGPIDSRKLIQALETKGYTVTTEDVGKYLGIYSAELNGGYGGLKVRGSSYVKLVNTTIAAIKRTENSKKK